MGRFYSFFCVLSKEGMPREIDSVGPGRKIFPSLDSERLVDGFTIFAAQTDIA